MRTGQIIILSKNMIGITEENVMDILEKKKSVKYLYMYLRMPECINVQKREEKQF
mgnify:CR=1 FL=1